MVVWTIFRKGKIVGRILSNGNIFIDRTSTKYYSAGFIAIFTNSPIFYHVDLRPFTADFHAVRLLQCGIRLLSKLI